MMKTYHIPALMEFESLKYNEDWYPVAIIFVQHILFYEWMKNQQTKSDATEKNQNLRGMDSE